MEHVNNSQNKAWELQQKRTRRLTEIEHVHLGVVNFWTLEGRSCDVVRRLIVLGSQRPVIRNKPPPIVEVGRWTHNLRKTLVLEVTGWMSSLLDLC